MTDPCVCAMRSTLLTIAFILTFRELPEGQHQSQRCATHKHVPHVKVIPRRGVIRRGVITAAGELVHHRGGEVAAGFAQRRKRGYTGGQLGHGCGGRGAGIGEAARGGVRGGPERGSWGDAGGFVVAR